MSLYHYLFFLGGLLFVSIASAGYKSNAHRDFYSKCIAAGHSRATCLCIYRRLERQYSPKLMHNLGNLSLQSPEVPHDFVKTMMRTMQQCRS
ncbi:hypothetical protein I5515_11380 [Acinetobacter calcoaceticus]|uniref:hypothetical protein n=1 Tax=Acinetobacter calcoaceticus TaxID=471 RepID=UPI0018FFB3FA|nr:hypothetical protein [Acinetobacter calcoaceticus]MBJ9722403.1 hypothetical protein [Acinetobacter calcoaceticus]